MSIILLLTFLISVSLNVIASLVQNIIFAWTSTSPITSPIMEKKKTKKVQIDDDEGDDPFDEDFAD